MLSSAPVEGAIVGDARTARITALRPSSKPAVVVRSQRMDDDRYMAEAPNPSIAVVGGVDFP